MLALVLALVAARALAAPPAQHILSPAPAPTDTLSLNSSFHGTFHPLAETHAFLRALHAAHPDVLSLAHVGFSAEGRDIVAAVLSRPQPKKNKNKSKKNKYKKKPRFLIIAAQHAREWIATSTALYLVHALAANASEPNSATALLDHFDFHIVPVANPDGYEYTWAQDRFWYKNVMPTVRGSDCLGIDMNRFGYEWAPPSGAPAEAPCAPWYPGTRPFEAPEVNALAHYAARVPRLRAFLDLRAYGQMLSIPYSYSCAHVPPDAEDLLEAALGAAAALSAVHDTPMTTGMLCSTLYRAPGNILDWVYAAQRVKYSFAAHLRDTGTYGFVLPEAWIRPVGEETAAMVGYLARFVADEEKTKKKNKKKQKMM